MQAYFEQTLTHFNVFTVKGHVDLTNSYYIISQPPDYTSVPKVIVCYWHEKLTDCSLSSDLLNYYCYISRVLCCMALAYTQFKKNEYFHF